MRLFAYLLVTLLVSLAFFGVCNGTVWFEGNTPQAPQEIKLDMKHIFQNGSSLPHCNLILNETESQQVNLTIIVDTAAWFYQSGNFNTSLAIDSQEPEDLPSIFDWQPSAMGELYNRKYNIKLNGLEEGSHSIKIRVIGDYYGPGPTGGIYLAEGNATFLIDRQTLISPEPNTTLYPSTSPTPTATFPESSYLPPNDRNAPHLEPIDYLLPISVVLAVAIALSLLLFTKHRKTKANLKQ